MLINFFSSPVQASDGFGQTYFYNAFDVIMLESGRIYEIMWLRDYKPGKHVKGQIFFLLLDSCCKD